MEDIASAAVLIVGAVLGSILALAFLPPKTMRDFLTRSTFSLIFGFVFAEPVRVWLKWEPEMSMLVAAASLTALASWWVWGAAVRLIGAYKIK